MGLNSLFKHIEPENSTLIIWSTRHIKILNIDLIKKKFALHKLEYVEDVVITKYGGKFPQEYCSYCLVFISFLALHMKVCSSS
jgi:hypothetical protein